MFKIELFFTKLNNITKKDIIDSNFIKLKINLFIYFILGLFSVNTLLSCGTKNESDKNAVESSSKTLKKKKIKNNISGKNLLDQNNLKSSDIPKTQELEEKDDLITKDNNNISKQTTPKKKKKKKSIIIVNNKSKKNLNPQIGSKHNILSKPNKNLNRRINTQNIRNRRNFQQPIHTRQQTKFRKNVQNRKSNINRFFPNFNRFNRFNNILPRMFNNTNQRQIPRHNHYRQQPINNNINYLNNNRNNNNVNSNILNNSNPNNRIVNNNLPVLNNNNMANINYNNDLELEGLNAILNNNLDQEEEQEDNNLIRIPNEGLRRYELTNKDKANLEEEKYITKMMLWLTNQKAWQQKDFNLLIENLTLYGNILRKEVNDKIDNNHNKIRIELNNMIKEYFKIIKKIKFKKFKTESEFIKIASVYNNICGFTSQINMIFGILKQSEKYEQIYQEGSWDQIDAIKDDMKTFIKILKNQVKIYDKIVFKNHFKNNKIEFEEKLLQSSKYRIEKIEGNIKLLKQSIDEKYLKNNNGNGDDILSEIDSIDRLIHSLIIEKQIAKYFAIGAFKFEKYTDTRYSFSKYYFRIRKQYSKIINFKKKIEEEINQKLMNEGN